MAVRRLPPRPAHSRPDLVAALVSELRRKNGRSGPGIPDIIEQQLTYGRKLQVTVIWDRWEGVGHDERGPIILDAYEQAFDLQTMLQVTLAVGLTPQEAQRLNIALPPAPPAAPRSRRKK